MTHTQRKHRNHTEMEALRDVLTWHGVKGRWSAANVSVLHGRAQSGVLSIDVLKVETAGSGYTRHEVCGVLQAVAESCECSLLVLPLPPAAAGRLRVALA